MQIERFINLKIVYTVYSKTVQYVVYYLLCIVYVWYILFYWIYQYYKVLLANFSFNMNFFLIGLITYYIQFIYIYDYYVIALVKDLIYNRSYFSEVYGFLFARRMVLLIFYSNYIIETAILSKYTFSYIASTSINRLFHLCALRGYIILELLYLGLKRQYVFIFLFPSHPPFS